MWNRIFTENNMIMLEKTSLRVTSFRSSCIRKKNKDILLQINIWLEWSMNTFSIYGTAVLNVLYVCPNILICCHELNEIYDLFMAKIIIVAVNNCFSESLWHARHSYNLSISCVLWQWWRWRDNVTYTIENIAYRLCKLLP